MTYQAEREDFLVKAVSEGLPIDVARLLLRHSNTLQRLAVAQCNGDWPADNGERKTVECEGCGSCWHPSVMKGTPKRCPDCRTTARVKAILPEGFTAIMNGDPRGAVLKIAVPSGNTDDWGREGICVPNRRY
jgi:hypothetical protein